MKKTKISIKTIKALTAAILLLNATHIVNNKLTITQAMEVQQNEVTIASKPTKLVNYYNEVKNLHMEELDHNHQNSKAFGILHTLRKHKYEDYLNFIQANQTLNTTEMDTVYNQNEGPFIQTFLFQNTGLMIGFLHKEKNFYFNGYHTRSTSRITW